MYASSSKRGKCVSTQMQSSKILPISCAGSPTEIRVCVLVSRTSQRIDSRRMLHVVNSQNVYHEVCFQGKTILYHVDLSFFAGSNSVYFLHELKQRSNDVTGQHQWLVDSEVVLGSTRFKGKAEIQARVSQLFQKTTPSSNGHPNTSERILRNYNKHKTY